MNKKNVLKKTSTTININLLKYIANHKTIWTKPYDPDFQPLLNLGLIKKVAVGRDLELFMITIAGEFFVKNF